jgi:DNA helicase HerA-like ATPase
VFWDLYGQQGHPIRTTISEMGPLLLARLLDLNETQEGVLNAIFRYADEQGLLLLDLGDLQALLQYCAENAGDLSAQYGNVTKSSVGSIQRQLLQLESQGAEHFFGEPAMAMPERSPFTSARKTGTPSTEKLSARPCRVTVLPVPVAPAMRPWRLARRRVRIWGAASLPSLLPMKSPVSSAMGPPRMLWKSGLPPARLASGGCAP